MRLLVVLTFVAAIALAFTGVGTADDVVTLEGKVVCAKCTLKKADAKECQNVLLVTGEDGKETEYYIAKNETGDVFGHVCTATKQATVTGSLSEKDGRKWITASKIEEKKG